MVGWVWRSKDSIGSLGGVLLRITDGDGAGLIKVGKRLKKCLEDWEVRFLKSWNTFSG
jgi:hypothetical protein